ncbi:hypothetical protein tca_00456 [Methanothermobacter sp. EMTCatA1]|jgi:hypothetical protein|nr:hypothetical protein tca_00456 [Methanothermobacter sp. EMTCatA1]
MIQCVLGCVTLRRYVAVAIIMAGLVLAAAYLSGGGAPVEGRVALVVFAD